MTLSVSRLVISIVFPAIAACGQIELGCEPVGGVRPYCGVQMPEDMEALPNGGGILIGEYGNAGELAGALTWFAPDIEPPFTRLVETASLASGASEENWGEPNCSLPNQLSPHGIHLSQRGEALQLLVVNHSSREHVLFYEVLSAAIAGTAPELEYRGCVVFPEYAVLNDVVALPDGGFAVTHMHARGNPTIEQLKVVLGLNDGHVWRWIPGSAVRVMANTQAKMPNGIEVAADGRSIWVNNYIEQELRQYDVASETLLKTVHVPNIDNSAWLQDGRLLLASHLSPLSMAPCFGLTQGSCGSPYELVAVDTSTGETETLYRSEEGGPFGPATVAIEYLGKIYAGSFSGDRLAEITLP